MLLERMNTNNPLDPSGVAPSRQGLRRGFATEMDLCGGWRAPKARACAMGSAMAKGAAIILTNPVMNKSVNPNSTRRNVSEGGLSPELIEAFGRFVPIAIGTKATQLHRQAWPDASGCIG